MDPPRCDGITDNVISPRLHGRGDLFREEEMETELDIDELLATGAGARRLSKEERQALLKDVREVLTWMDDSIGAILSNSVTVRISLPVKFMRKLSLMIIPPAYFP